MGFEIQDVSRRASMYVTARTTPAVGTTPQGMKVQVGPIKTEVDKLLLEFPKNEKTAAILFFREEKKLEDLIKIADPETKQELEGLQKRLASALGSKALHLTKDKQTREDSFIKLVKEQSPVDSMLKDVQATRRFGIILSKELVMGMYSSNTQEKSSASEKCELLLKGLVSGKEMRDKLYKALPGLEPLVREYLFFHSPASEAMKRLAEIAEAINQAPDAQSAVKLFDESTQLNSRARQLIGKGATSSWADDLLRLLHESIQGQAIEIIDKRVKDEKKIPEKVQKLRELAKQLDEAEEAKSLESKLLEYDRLSGEIQDSYPKHPLLRTSLINRIGIDASISQAKAKALTRLELHPDVQKSIMEAKGALAEAVSALATLEKGDLVKELQSSSKLDGVMQKLQVPKSVQKMATTALFHSDFVDKLFSNKSTTTSEAELVDACLEQAFAYLIEISGPHYSLGESGEALEKLLNALSDPAWLHQRGVSDTKRVDIQPHIKMLKEVVDELSIRTKNKKPGELTDGLLKAAGEMVFYLDPKRAQSIKLALDKIPFGADAHKAISAKMDEVIAKMQTTYQRGLDLIAIGSRDNFLKRLESESNPMKRQELFSTTFKDAVKVMDVAAFSSDKQTQDFLSSIKALGFLLGQPAPTLSPEDRGTLMLRAQDIINIVTKGFGAPSYEMLRNCQIADSRDKLLALKAFASDAKTPYDALQ